MENLGIEQQLKQRLKDLKGEFETGQEMLAEVEAKRTSLQESLLRISGAIQVLEEEVAKLGQLSGSDDEQPEKKNEIVE